MHESHDVIVVGGRVAGAATGMLLARQGLDVLVVDRGTYGSDTFSTHAFMRAGVLQLSRWGLLGEIVDAGTPPVRRTTIRYGEQEDVVDIRPMPGFDALYAPRRWLLDRILADAASRAGATLRFRTSVTSLLRDDDGRVTGVEMRGPDRQTRTAAARLVIGADGANSLVAHNVGARRYHQGHHAGMFVGGYFSQVHADGYQWLYSQAGSAGVIPTNCDQVSAWISVPSTRFAQLRRLPDKGFWGNLDRIAPDWADRLRTGRQHGPLRAFPGIAGHLRTPHGPGWALVGDASYFKDPITAHGMTDAVRDAELLARAVVDGRDTGDMATALTGYQTLRDRLSVDLLRISDRVAAYDWELDELRELLLSMSVAMKAEVAHLQGLSGVRS